MSLFSMPWCTLLPLIGCFLLHPVACQWSIEPEIVTDKSGNSADNASSVTWAKTPPGDAYVSTTKYSTGYLTIPVIFAHCFTNLAQPNAFPIGIVTGIFDNTFVMSRDYKQLLNYSVGIIICVAIGLLFSILMPIIGCCFCCCRLAGKCGGKRMQKVRPNDCCKKTAYVVCLSIISAIIGFGTIGMFLSNERMTDAIQNYNTTIRNCFGDLRTYLGNLGQEVRHISVTNFNFTTEVISRDLDCRGFLVGVPVRNHLDEVAGVTGVIPPLLALGNEIQVVGSKLLEINSSIEQLKDDSMTLEQGLDDVRTTIEDAQRLPGCEYLCQNIDTSTIKMDVDFRNLPNISSQAEEIQDAMSANFNGLVLQGEATFNSIPSMTVSQTENLVSDVKSRLREFLTQIETKLKAVLEMPSKFDSQVSDIKSKALNVADMAIKYNKARWLACLVMTLIVVLVVVLQVYGMCFGVCGYRPSAKPIERTSLSNSGGNCLMAAVGFIKIFSWLMMLVNTVLFAVGSNAEKLICQGMIQDPQYAVIKKLLDGPGGIMCSGCSTYMLSDMLLGNGTIPLKFSETLESCKNNEPAYPTLKLSYLVDLNAVTDYKQAIDIESKINAMSVDLSSIQLMSGSMIDQLHELISSTRMNYTAFNDTLTRNLTTFNADDFVVVLDSAANDSFDPAKSRLQRARDQLRDLLDGIYLAVEQQQTQLFDQVLEFRAQTSELPKRVNDSINATQLVQDKIQTLGPSIIKEQIALLANRLETVADNFVNHSLYEIQSNVGRCSPIWRIWESLGDVAVCKYTVDTLNCFWFSIGCALFFMIPSLIFDVKLAKHFQRMKCMEEFQAKPIYPQDVVKTQVIPIAKKGKEKAHSILASSKITPIG